MIDWIRVKHFNPTENWGDIHKVKPILVYQLDKMRDYTGKPFIIHNAYEARKGYHGEGMAADGHFEDMSLVDQYLLAERFSWGGLGLYTFWNNPGIHVDIRPHHARWGSHEKGKYVSLNEKFLFDCMGNDIVGI